MFPWEQNQQKLLSSLASSLVGTKLLREQSNNGTINLMSSWENSTLEATETVKMPLTPLTIVQLSQKGGGSAVPFQRMDAWCHLLALHWSWVQDPSFRNERIQGTRGSLRTLECVLWETGMDADRTLRVLTWAQMSIIQWYVYTVHIPSLSKSLFHSASFPSLLRPIFENFSPF